MIVMGLIIDHVLGWRNAGSKFRTRYWYVSRGGAEGVRR
jgi:hypothetical protein